MAKKILADGTIAYVGTICFATVLDIDIKGLCKILRTKGFCKNSIDKSWDLDTNPYVLCEFEKTGERWFVDPNFVRRATKEEKKQWPQK